MLGSPQNRLAIWERVLQGFSVIFSGEVLREIGLYLYGTVKVIAARLVHLRPSKPALPAELASGKGAVSAGETEFRRKVVEQKLQIGELVGRGNAETLCSQDALRSGRAEARCRLKPWLKPR